MAGNNVTLTFAGDSRSLEQATDRVGASTREMGEQVERTNQSFVEATGGAGTLVDGLDAIGQSTQAMSDIMSYSERHAEDLARAHTDVAQAAQDVDQAIADMRQALRDATQAGLDTEQAAIDLEQALLDQATAQKEYNQAVREHGPASDEAKQAAIDLKQATQDTKQAKEDDKQATEDLNQANLDAAQGVIDQQEATDRLTASQRELEAQSGVLKTITDWSSMLSGVLGGLVGVIGLVTAAQWAWNAAMVANPIGLVIAGLVVFLATIAAFVWAIWNLVENWDTVWANIKDIASSVGRWFRDVLWQGWIMASWNGIIGGGRNALKWLSSMPGRLRSVFARVGSYISRPFRSAFNAISRAWNNTVGRLSWSVPSWVPGIGGNSVGAPRLPTFHQGGIVPGAPGQELLAVLQAGERVTPAGQAAGPPVLEIRSGGTRLDDLLVEVLSAAIMTRGGNVQAVLGRSRG